MLSVLLSLLAGPGAQAAAPGQPGAAVPLYALSDGCLDDRFPRLAGPYVVGCGKGGMVDRVLSLSTGLLWELPRALHHAGTGEAAIYAAGPEGALLQLRESGPSQVEDITVVREAPFAMPTTDGVHLAVLSVDHVQAFEAHERGRRLVETRAAGWEAPALSWPLVAWTVVDEGGDHDVMVMNAEERGQPEPLAGGPGDQRLVVSQGGRFAWVDEGDVVLTGPEGQGQERVEAHTGFRSAPTLWEGVACWENREEDEDIDLRCSDGWHLDRPGDQLSPSRWGPWLLFQEDGRAWLYTAETP